MKFTPGQRFSYSNSGYMLLGIVIEDVTGIPYADFVQEHIFAACGMHDSGYFAMNRLPERTAWGYIEDDQGWRTNIFNLPIIGASDGGAFSTVRDLHKLWMAFFDARLLSREMMTIFLAKAVSAAANWGPNRCYGHGIWIDHDSAKAPLYFILGSDAGVSFLSKCSRTGDTLMTIISNTTDGAWPMRRVIDSMLWKDIR